MKEIPFFDQRLDYKKISSTFSEARKLILNREVQGNFLLVTETQTAGKGRNTNHWFSPGGGLWFTAGFYNLPLRSSLTLYLAICITQSINELFPETTGELAVKWPNDLMLQNKKLGGILTSAFPDLKYIISGIGLNTNNREFPPELQNIAVSLAYYTGREIDNEDLLSKIFEKFAEGLPDYLDNELLNLKPLYDRDFSYLKDKKVILQTDYEEFIGRVKGINQKGALILQLENGSFQPFYSGSITWIEDN